MPDDVRARATSFALSLAGLTHPDPRYSALVAPGETKARAAEMARMSGCALVVAAVWRAVGIERPSLAAPYKDRTAVSRLMVIAHAANAWIPYSDAAQPCPGDAVLLEGPEHVYIAITSWRDPYGDLVLDGIDGGQLDGYGAQKIEHKTHEWSGNRESAYPVGHEERRGLTRPVLGWICLARVAEKFGS